MRPERKTPGKQGASRRTWAYVPQKGGGAYNGWLAGKCEWVLVHHVGNSKPCFDELTDGAIACPYCRPRCRRDWIGYVPVYDAAGRQCLAVVQDYSEVVVEKIPVYSPVTVRRGDEDRAPQTVTPSGWSKDQYRRLSETDQGVDVFPALLMLWQQPLLSAHFAGGTDTTVPPAAVEPPPPAVEIPPAVVERMRGPALPPKVEAEMLLEGVMNSLNVKLPRLRNGTPSANGKHPPPAAD